MAVPRGALDRGEYQFFTVSSDDPGVEAGSTASDFRVKLAQPLYFPGGGDEWVMTIVYASFGVPADANSYEIATSVNQRQMNGSETVATVVTIPAGSPGSAAGPFTWVPTSQIPIWVPIAQELVSDIEIEIAPFPGSAPITTTTPSSVTIAVRKVGAR